MIKLTRCRLSIWVSKFRSSSDFSLLNCNKTWALEILAFGMMISLIWISARKHSKCYTPEWQRSNSPSLIKQLFLAELVGTALERGMARSQGAHPSISITSIQKASVGILPGIFSPNRDDF